MSQADLQVNFNPDPLSGAALPESNLVTERQLFTKNGLAFVHSVPTERKSDIQIINLHGASHDSFFYKNFRQLSALRGFESFSLDFEGHGNSRPVKNRPLGATLKDYANNISELLEHLYLNDLSSNWTPLAFNAHSLASRSLLKFLKREGHAHCVQATTCIAGVPWHGIKNMMAGFLFHANEGESFGGFEHSLRYLQSAIKLDPGCLLNGSLESAASLLFSTNVGDLKGSRVKIDSLEDFRREHLGKESLLAFLEAHLSESLSGVPKEISFLMISSENDRLVPPKHVEGAVCDLKMAGFPVSYIKYDLPCHDMLLDPDHIGIGSDILEWVSDL